MLERIVFISELCRACRRCEVACIAAHHGMDIKEATKRRAEFISRVRVIKGEGYKTTTRCHECDNAPCCHICPTGALEQFESGEVVMHDELCIACEMCADACPYGAIQMDVTSLPVVKMEDNPDDEELTQPRKVAVRCDLCRDWRKANGKAMTPCMEACPAQCIGLMLEDGSTLFPEKPQKKPVPAAAQAERPAAAPEAAAPGTADKAVDKAMDKAVDKAVDKAEGRQGDAPRPEAAPEANPEANPEARSGVELRQGNRVITVENAPEPPAEGKEEQDKSA